MGLLGHLHHDIADVGEGNREYTAIEQLVVHGTQG